MKIVLDCLIVPFPSSIYGGSLRSLPSLSRPLHLAAALLKVPEIIDLLLNNEVEVDARNNSHSTPLFTACQANNPYAASKLIANGMPEM